MTTKQTPWTSKRIVPGRYEVSYSGHEAIVYQRDKEWFIEPCPDALVLPIKKKTDLLTAWVKALDAATPPPAPAKRAGPPPILGRANIAPVAERVAINDITTETTNPFLPDFFDPRLFRRGETDRNEEVGSWILLPLGACVEVYSWCLANIPFAARTQFPWVRVRAVIEREAPEVLAKMEKEAESE